jgi:hypothetical protein
LKRGFADPLGMKWIWLAVLSLSFAWAKPQKAKPTKRRPAAVRPAIWVNGFSDSVRAVFSSPDYRYADNESYEKDMHRAGHLPPWTRDEIFQKLKIESKMAKWDELGKDMLVIRARQYAAKKLKARYPMFSMAQIKDLKREIGKAK